MKTRGVYEAKTRFIDDQRQWRGGHNITLGDEVAIREFIGEGQEGDPSAGATPITRS
jgi:hypothetical protein